MGIVLLTGGLLGVIGALMFMKSLSAMGCGDHATLEKDLLIEAWYNGFPLKHDFAHQCYIFL